MSSIDFPEYVGMGLLVDTSDDHFALESDTESEEEEEGSVTSQVETDAVAPEVAPKHRWQRAVRWVGYRVC